MGNAASLAHTIKAASDDELLHLLNGLTSDDRTRLGRGLAEADAACADTGSSGPQLPTLDSETVPLNMVFREFDVNGSGALERNEVDELFKALDQPLSHGQLDQLLSVVDQDGDGRISYEELLDSIAGAKMPDSLAGTSDNVRAGLQKLSKHASGHSGLDLAACTGATPEATAGSGHSGLDLAACTGVAPEPMAGIELRRFEPPPTTYNALSAWCARMYQFFNGFEAPDSVAAVGSESAGDMAHLLLGVHRWTLAAFLLRLGAAKRIEQGGEACNRTCHQLLRMPTGGFIRCSRRPEGDSRKLPNWLETAFPSVDTDSFLTGYEICEEIRDFHQQHGLGHVSALEMLYGLDAPGVGAASHFFSHSQAENLHQTMCCLAQADKFIDGHPSFFVDYVCIRQCAKGDFKPHAVQAMITEIGCTVMGLTPVVEAIALRRAWCVFEVACTLRGRAKFMSVPYLPVNATFKGSDWRKMKEHLQEGLKNIRVSLEDCESRDPNDKDMVLAIIKETTGLDKANDLVAKAVRKGLEDSLKYVKEFVR
eukprot:TRINITY_DN46799_c0_g1_i1.p1 TRINITY_DN46799_c0_g1~~TRINITY_DN46799_c0_g1_i1.p1  ORF type:complete len:538 (+),score=70.28 TRINITY_DN46799_c0_g1_i1:64-1677(+)